EEREKQEEREKAGHNGMQDGEDLGGHDDGHDHHDDQVEIVEEGDNAEPLSNEEDSEDAPGNGSEDAEEFSEEEDMRGNIALPEDEIGPEDQEIDEEAPEGNRAEGEEGAEGQENGEHRHHRRGRGRRGRNR